MYDLILTAAFVGTEPLLLETGLSLAHCNALLAELYDIAAKTPLVTIACVVPL